MNIPILRPLFVRLGLEFEDPVEEAAFADHYVRSHLRWSQFFLVLGGMFYYSFFVWDRLIDPVHANTTHMIRGLIVLPVFLICAILPFFKRGQRMIEILILASLTAGQLGLAVIYSILDQGFDYASFGFAIMFLGTTSMFQVRMKYLWSTPLFMLVTGLGAQLLTGNSRPAWLVLNAMAIASATGFGGMSSWLREHAARRQYRTDQDLDQARGRIDELLYSMLPIEIVKRIQSGETAIADSHDEVSIVFADLVGFTDLARRVTPSQLLTLLNSLFSDFDRDAERFHIDRIKTIGDAYMAIGGLERGASARDHAENAAKFAFSMLDTVRKMVDERGYPINIRIGIHIGSVVAGVIGVKRPAFDCWGEAVNLASRLEAQALPGTILISETSYWRLKPHFEMDVLDAVDLKGIGTTKVYQLVAPRAAPLSEPAAAQ